MSSSTEITVSYIHHNATSTVSLKMDNVTVATSSPANNGILQYHTETGLSPGTSYEFTLWENGVLLDWGNQSGTAICTTTGEQGTTTSTSTTPPGPQPGDSDCGGYFVGIIDTTKGNIQSNDASQTGLRYALIVGPQSTVPLQWRIQNREDNARSRWDGLYNTNSIPYSEDYPAFKFVKDLASQNCPGGSEWYLPAVDELELIYRNIKPGDIRNSSGHRVNILGGMSGQERMGENPSSDPPGPGYTNEDPPQTQLPNFQEGGAQAIDKVAYWSSTERADGEAWSQQFVFGTFSHGNQNRQNKGHQDRYVVAVRRILL